MPSGLFSCAMSGDGGVTTRSSFISPPGYDAWCNQQGASLLHHSQTAGERLGWCTEAKHALAIFGITKRMFTMQRLQITIWQDICCLALCSEEINPILFVIFRSVSRVDHVWRISFFYCLCKGAQTCIIKQIHAQHGIWVMNSKPGVVWVLLNFPQLSKTSKAGLSLIMFGCCFKSQTCAPTEAFSSVSDQLTFCWSAMWWISNMWSIFHVALCQPPFSCTFNPVWSGSHQLMTLISLPSHHKQTHTHKRTQARTRDFFHLK